MNTEEFNYNQNDNNVINKNPNNTRKSNFKKTYKTPLIVILVLTIIFIILLVISLITDNNYTIIANIPDYYEMDMESKYTINAFISPDTDKYYITDFLSTNINVVRVNNNGIVEALSEGECTIIINTNKDKIYKNITIKVIDKNIYPEKIELTKKDYSLRINQTDLLDYTIYPVNTTKPQVTITKDNDVIEINDKTIKAVKEGTSIITIKTINNKEVTASVIVSNKAESINVDKEKINIKVGDTNTIKASVLPEDSLRKDLTYTIKDTNIATITNNTIKGLKKGKTTLTISNNEVSKTIEINVKENLLVTLKEFNLLKNKLNSLNKKSLSETDTTYLLFGSDYQDAGSTFPKLLNYTKSQNVKPNLVGLLGDYKASNVGNHTNEIKEADKKIKEYFPDTATLYLQGNHDNDSTQNIQATGAYIGNNYILYVINTKDNPRITGSSCSSSSATTKISEKLDTFLKTLNDLDIKAPILILTHVPIHDNRNDNACGYKIGEVVNKYKNLNIFLMYGHNHSGKYDDCMGGSMNYYPKGSTINFSEKNNSKPTKINFYYLNAGYVGLERNTNGQVTCSGTKVTSSNANSMSLFTITDDHIKIERYTNSKIIKVLDLDLK